MKILKEKGREKEFHYDHSDLMCHQRTACATAVLCTKMANLLLPCLSCDVIFGILRAFSLHQHNSTRTSISQKRRDEDQAVWCGTQCATEMESKIDKQNLLIFLSLFDLSKYISRIEVFKLLQRFFFTYYYYSCSHLNILQPPALWQLYFI